MLKLRYLHSKPYGNFLMVGNFNMSLNTSNLKDFMTSCFPSGNLIKKSMCCKSFSPCIDSIIFNREILFMKQYTFKIGLSDCEKVVTTILRKNPCKVNPKANFYRNYNSLVTSHCVISVTLCNTCQLL